MLLSRDAIVAGVEAQLGPDDFYKPAHGHVFEAVTALYAQGEPADPVTVAEELRRAGVLDGIGGPATLISLQARTPAISNATRYARIVEEYALLRRLIAVAGEIAEMGYSVPDDVIAAIDAAEALVFEVAQRRVTDSMLPIRELLERHLDHIEALYERGQDIIGVPTGYVDLDQQLAGLQPSNLVIVGGRPGTGKALSLDTPIPTPSGWTTMGGLVAGDELLDEQGQPCRVSVATPVMLDRRCYEVVFDDGSTIVADADHQWLAYDYPAWRSHRDRQYRASRPPRNPASSRDQTAHRRNPRVVTTQQMREEGIHVRRDSRPNWYIALSKPLDLPEVELPVDPYVLGCWLGDGKTKGSEITVGEADWRHFHHEFTSAGYHFESGRRPQWATVPVGGKGTAQGYGGPLRVLTRELQSVGLLAGRRKHIPAMYLRASMKQRLALLQGLLDTDGHISPNGSVDLCLSNLLLLEHARELVCSLGHKPGPIRERSVRLPGGRSGSAWRFGWVPLDPVFRLPRKAERYESARSRRTSGRIARRAVTAIRPVPSVPVRCITVDSPSRLYLAGREMIPTHNTSFALGMASHAALDGRHPVLVFSLEMSHLELTQRLLCSEARVDASRMRNGRLLETDWPKISHAVGRLAEAPINIDDNPHLTVMEIRAKARRLKSRQGLGLIVVDYLQLMTGRQSAENRQVEVSEISRGLKILARELEVPVVALSQLSRNLETRSDKRPVLADLRESGSLEQDADVVIFLYRDELYNRDSPDRGTAEVIVAKHRNGPTGITQLAFLENYTRFANMARGV
jgi:replicative DNA helicase